MKQKLISSVKKFIKCCEMEGFQPCLLEVREKDSVHSMIMDIPNGNIAPKSDNY